MGGNTAASQPSLPQQQFVQQSPWLSDAVVMCSGAVVLEPLLLQAHTQQLAATCLALKAQREARVANLNPTRPGRKG